jgi:hypothetical protein
MRPETPFQRLRVAGAVCALALGLAALQGSSSSSSLTKEDEAKMRAGFERHGPLNINDVPPAQREHVRAFMQMNAAGRRPSPGGAAH